MELEAGIIKKAQQLGTAIPKHILNAPDIEPYDEVFWRAYVRLDTCRSGGMCAMPIPWTAIRDYADWYDFCEEQFERLESVIGKMDRAYLKWVERKSDGNKSKPPTVPKTHGSKSPWSRKGS